MNFKEEKRRLHISAHQILIQTYFMVFYHHLDSFNGYSTKDLQVEKRKS